MNLIELMDDFFQYNNLASLLKVFLTCINTITCSKKILKNPCFINVSQNLQEYNLVKTKLA